MLCTGGQTTNSTFDGAGMGGGEGFSCISVMTALSRTEIEEADL